LIKDEGQLVKQSKRNVIAEKKPNMLFVIGDVIGSFDVITYNHGSLDIRHRTSTESRKRVGCSPTSTVSKVGLLGVMVGPSAEDPTITQFM
jgi:hypothetical protein